MLPLEPDTDFWIIVSNVHEKAAYEDIIRVLFEKCGKLKSQYFQFDSSDHFRGTIYVAYESREEANEAVTLYDKNVTLFGKTWNLQLINKRKRTRFCDAASSSATTPESCGAASPSTRQVTSSLRSSTVALGTVESSSAILSGAVRTLSLQDAAGGTGPCSGVLISNIHVKVPSEFIELLFEKAGRLRSITVHTDSRCQSPSTVLVVYERVEDAISAVKQFANNVTFFGNAWSIELDSKERSHSSWISDWPTAKGKQKV